MGCHTWCYRKIDRTIEEAKQIWLKAQIKSIARWEDIVNNPEDECRVVYEWTQEECQDTLNILKRKLNFVSKGLVKEAFCKHEQSALGERRVWFDSNTKAFYQDTEFHDPFRIWGYPVDFLYSYEECLKYITKFEETHGVKIHLYVNPITGEQSLKKFWETYPDGQIHFG